MRKLILEALYEDDWLYSQLIFKGGNALSMIYKVGMRTSLDLDFSIKNDFPNLNKVSKIIYKALIKKFRKNNIYLFDYSFNAKPKETNNSWWGGYRVEFKLIHEVVAKKLDYDVERLRRQAINVDPGSQKRKYTIEISKYEYIDGFEEKDYNGITILVYSPLLLAIEKLRAILQQHPDYKPISNRLKRSRSRDFYDIWALCDYFSINLAAHLEDVKAVFSAKKVDLELLKDLKSVRNLHFASWSDVELSLASDIEEFDFYFTYVNDFAIKLYSKWKINSP